VTNGARPGHAKFPTGDSAIVVGANLTLAAPVDGPVATFLNTPFTSEPQATTSVESASATI
jgi:hypothetical protein